MKLIISHSNTNDEVTLTFNELIDVINFLNNNEEFIGDWLEQDKVSMTIEA